MRKYLLYFNFARNININQIFCKQILSMRIVDVYFVKPTFLFSIWRHASSPIYYPLHLLSISPSKISFIKKYIERKINDVYFVCWKLESFVFKIAYQYGFYIITNTDYLNNFSFLFLHSCFSIPGVAFKAW